MVQVCNLLGPVGEHHEQPCRVLVKKVLCQPRCGSVQDIRWCRCNSHTLASPAEFEEPSTQLKHAHIKQCSELIMV